jgi:hypothetical protein
VYGFPDCREILWGNCSYVESLHFAVPSRGQDLPHGRFRTFYRIERFSGQFLDASQGNFSDLHSGTQAAVCLEGTIHIQ